MDKYKKIFNHKYEHELQSLLTKSDAQIRNTIDQTLSTISEQMSQFRTAQMDAEAQLTQMTTKLLQSCHNISSMGVRTDLIHTNVKVSCPDETCLLDFYTKLRMAMIQAGIYLRALVIPQDFTFAQNCIKSQSTTMDGFSALTTMLSLVHPILNNHCPPHHPPVVSTFNDIHLYEQGLRNFYLFHSICGRSEYT